MANNLVHMLVQLYRLFTEETNACILEEQSSIFYAGFSSFILLIKTLWGIYFVLSVHENDVVRQIRCLF
jgi:hypothetical protein